MAIAKINGKQVNLLLALFSQAMIRSTRQQLEWIEYECGIQVTKLEDINTGELSVVIKKIKDDFGII